MKILLKNDDLNEALTNVSNLGFVPTMGGLHKGHISLIKKSKLSSNKTLVSIFVNPRQFNNKRDYKRYPRSIKNDLSILKKLKVDYIFIPNEKDIYKPKRRKKIKLNDKDKILCAKFRKGHFEGVLDIMDRLITLINPKKVYMGEKNFQQLYLVKKFIEKKYKSKIINCKTIRNKNKLALSSRISLLKKKEIYNAENLSKDLFFFKKKLLKNNNMSKHLEIKKEQLDNLYQVNIEYLELRNRNTLKKTTMIKNAKLFVAYYVGRIRLIDNF